MQDIDPKEYSRLLSLNLLANQALIAAFDPLLQARPTAPTSSRSPRRSVASLAPSRALMVRTRPRSRSLLGAYADDEAAYLDRIKVHMVDPGATRTRMRANAFPGEEPESMKPAGGRRPGDRRAFAGRRTDRRESARRSLAAEEQPSSRQARRHTHNCAPS